MLSLHFFSGNFAGKGKNNDEGAKAKNNNHQLACILILLRAPENIEFLSHFTMVFKSQFVFISRALKKAFKGPFVISKSFYSVRKYFNPQEIYFAISATLPDSLSSFQGFKDY